MFNFKKKSHLKTISTWCIIKLKHNPFILIIFFTSLALKNCLSSCSRLNCNVFFQYNVCFFLISNKLQYLLQQKCNLIIFLKLLTLFLQPHSSVTNGYSSRFALFIFFIFIFFFSFMKGSTVTNINRSKYVSVDFCCY